MRKNIYLKTKKSYKTTTSGEKFFLRISIECLDLCKALIGPGYYFKQENFTFRTLRLQIVTTVGIRRKIICHHFFIIKAAKFGYSQAI